MDGETVRLTVRAVLFDLDGTLTQFNIDYRSARSEINEELEALGLGELRLREGTMIYTMLDHVQERMPEDGYRRFLTRVQTLIEKYEHESAAASELQPYARETLLHLREEGLKTAIVTNNCQIAAKMVVDRFGLSPLLDALVTREDVPRWKPDGAMVRETLSRLRVSPSEALFVGDSVIDIQAARDSGVSSVALSTGPTRTSRLLEEAPDYLLSSLAEIPVLIKEVCQGHFT